jgi:hypothetical protein
MDHDTITPTAGNCEPSLLPASLREWVESAAARGLTPDQARRWLTSQGWPSTVGDSAALEVERLGNHPQGSLAPPPGPVQAHEHGFAYTTLFVTLGFAVLSLGSTIHLLLEWAFESRSGSQALANWLTVFLCTVPFAVASLRVVRRIEAEDHLARYSQVRDSLSMLLLWAAGIVGGIRLLAFVHQLVSALIVDREVSSLGWDLAHVVTVVVLSGSVFAWTWRFRHPR